MATTAEPVVPPAQEANPSLAAPSSSSATGQEEAIGSTAATTAAAVSSFGNFDVLLVAEPETGILNLAGSVVLPGGSSSSSPAQQQPHQHIGNTRFQVTLDMHRTDFCSRHERGQDTSPIVNKLVAIVTEQCVPPGRFLQSKPAASAATAATQSTVNNNSSDVWTAVPHELVVEFIERSLMPNKKDNSSSNNNNNSSPAKGVFRRGSALRASSSLGSGGGGSNPNSNNNNRRVSFADNMAASIEQIMLDNSNSSGYNDSSHSNSEEDQARLVALAKKQQQQSMMQEDEEKKRRRRSSLLRRSLSEHLMPVAREVEDKKKMNRTTEERRPSLWRALFKHKVVKHPDTLDIVLVFLGESNDDDNNIHNNLHNKPQSVVPEATDLVPDHTGNNRLRVMMQMSKEKYAAASIDEQAAMCQEWINTVTTYWKGRFLKHDSILEQYEVLETGQVEMALDKVMIRMIEGDHDKHWSEVEHGGLSALWEGSKEFASGEFSSNSFQPQPSGEFSVGSFQPGASSEFQIGSSSSSMEFAKGSRSAEFRNRGRFGRGRKPRQASNTSVASAPVLPSPKMTSGNQQDERSLRRSMKAFLPNFGRSASASAAADKNSASQRRQSNLPEPPANILSEENVQAQRSAAVESLQRRKKRQGLASRIQRMAQNSFMRASINSKSSQPGQQSETQQAAQQVQNMMMMQERRTSYMSTNSAVSAMSSGTNMSATPSSAVPSSNQPLFPHPPTTIYSLNNHHPNDDGGGSRNTHRQMSALSAGSAGAMDPMDISSSKRRTSNSSVSTSGSSLMPGEHTTRMPDLDGDGKLPANVYAQPPSLLQQQQQQQLPLPHAKNPPNYNYNNSSPSPIPSSLMTGPSPVPSVGNVNNNSNNNNGQFQNPGVRTVSEKTIDLASDGGGDPNPSIAQGDIGIIDLPIPIMPNVALPVTNNGALNKEEKSGEAPVLDNLLFDELVPSPRSSLNKVDPILVDDSESNSMNDSMNNNKRQARNEGLRASDIIQDDLLESPRSSLKKEDPVVNYEGENPVINPSASM